MRLTIGEASDETHRLLAGWRYPPPYDFYDGDVDPLLNPERYFEENPPDLDYGLGLRPDLTGQGLGVEFFVAGLDLARERYRPRRIFLHVAEFNERARRVYERAGFRVVSSHVRRFERFGDVPFLTMADAPTP